MSSPRLKPAIAFFRRKANASRLDDLQSERVAIEAYAERSGYEIVFEFSHIDEGDEELLDSPAFEAMLTRVAAQNVRAVIVATATTFAQNPLVQAVGAAKFRKFGVEVLAVEPAAPLAVTISPSQLVERILAIEDKFEKQLSHMAEKRRKRFGPPRRKNYAEMFPEAVSLAKRLHQKSLTEGVRRSLRELSAMLAVQGHLNNAGNPYHPNEIRRMINGPDQLRDSTGAWQQPDRAARTPALAMDFL
jgi:phosphoglycolate phosphatase-like HAD superfamily hydrolase